MYGGCGLFKGVDDSIRLAAHFEVWKSDSPDIVTNALQPLPLLDVDAIVNSLTVRMSPELSEKFWITLRLFENRQDTLPRQVIQQQDALYVSNGIGVEDDVLHYNLCVINGQARRILRVTLSSDGML